ncbi:MAG: TRAP transporter small permease [Anaerolineales bacterium]|nr:TRAP transporter small permease [Anaerolineales bacterium]
MLTLILVDIGMRVAGLPSVGADELASMLLVGLTFLALGSVTQRREHIAVKLFSNQLLSRRIGSVLLHIVPTALYVTVLSYLIIEFALDAYFTSARSEGMWRIPLYLPRLVIVVGLVVMLLTVVRHLLAHNREEGQP